MDDPHKELNDKELNVEEMTDKEATSWYEKWRARIHEWTMANAGETLADILLLIPDFFMMLVGLTRDKRIPLTTKGQILIALAYVVTPTDLMPEAVLGVAGLADDAGFVGMLMFSLTQLKGVDPSILREHWRGQGDVVEVINRFYTVIENNAEKLFDHEIWQKIKQRFSRDSSTELPPSESKSRFDFSRLSSFWRRGEENDPQ